MRKKSRDLMTPEQRSYCMSRVKSKNTRIEVIVRSELFKKGLRFRKHVKELPGTPDVVFPSKKVCLEIYGDFWHGRYLEKRNLNPYWKDKIKRNIARDKRNTRKLKKLGWKVIKIWESDAYKDMDKELSKVIALLKSAC